MKIEQKKTGYLFTIGIILLWCLINNATANPLFKKPNDGDAIFHKEHVYQSGGLEKSAKSDLELVKLFVKGDTLNIVSTSDFLYYPLGKFVTQDKFNRVNKKFKVAIVTDIKDKSVKMTKMSYNKSFVKLYHDHDKKALEIVSGNIVDPEVILVNGIKCSIDKVDFLKVFFNNVSSNQVLKIKVIKMISGLAGISHIYNFNNNKLTSFYFDSDYQFDKK